MNKKKIKKLNRMQQQIIQQISGVRKGIFIAIRYTEILRQQKLKSKLSDCLKKFFALEEALGQFHFYAKDQSIRYATEDCKNSIDIKSKAQFEAYFKKYKLAIDRAILDIANSGVDDNRRINNQITEYLEYLERFISEQF